MYVLLMLNITLHEYTEFDRSSVPIGDQQSVKTWKGDSVNALIFIRALINVYWGLWVYRTVLKWFSLLTLIPQDELNNQPHP